jgi:ribonuclease Z
MSTSLRPRLVNGRFGDPGLFVEFSFEREALLLDCGDLSALSARDLLRIRTVGVTHMHMDHLIGFDQLLRVNVGREARIDVFGPEGLADRLGHKLRGYSWDLADSYETELFFAVTELHEEGHLRRFRFRFSQGFEPEDQPDEHTPDGLLCETSRWHLSAAILEHHGPCLGFALEEPWRINVWKSRLEEHGLPTGPWLTELKRAVRNRKPGDTPIALPDGGTAPLDELRDIVQTTPGGKIGYATDLRDTPANRAALQHLCADARIMFIEASFRAHDAEQADARAHLTTRAAGEIAKSCRAGRVEPFHFSTRYEGEEEAILAEVRSAFSG